MCRQKLISSIASLRFMKHVAKQEIPSMSQFGRHSASYLLRLDSFYLFEPGDEAERRQLNDRELAVRLSYFLWSEPPDTELLQLAEQNTLHHPEMLRQQVDRLIANPRSDEFVALGFCPSMAGHGATRLLPVRRQPLPGF